MPTCTPVCVSGTLYRVRVTAASQECAMTDGGGFSFDGLFSGRAPAPRPGAAVQRGKYDFAVAYPDPDSLPLGDLAIVPPLGARRGGPRPGRLPSRAGLPAPARVRCRQADAHPQHRRDAGRHHPGGRLQPAAAHDHRDPGGARRRGADRGLLLQRHAEHPAPVRGGRPRRGVRRGRARPRRPGGGHRARVVEGQTTQDGLHDTQPSRTPRDGR